MGKKNKKILRKSMFGGFKKADVINYIEKIQQENVNVRRELNDYAAYKRDFESVSAAKEQAEKELAILKAENESLKAKNVELIGENASYNMKIEEMKVEVSETEKALKESEAKVDELEKRMSDVESVYSKIKNAENIIEDAKITAEAIVNNARSSVDGAKNDILSSTDRIRTACINYDSASASLAGHLLEHPLARIFSNHLAAYSFWLASM